MKTVILAGCSLLAVVLLGGLPALAAPVQTAPTPAIVAQASPSPDEMKKFASAVKQLLALAETTDTQMTQVVQKAGLTAERFNEIHRGTRDPNAKPKTPVTPQEQQSYDRAVAQLTQMQKDAQSKMDQVVVKEGLAVERFNQIFELLQKNPQLREQVQKMITN